MSANRLVVIALGVLSGLAGQDRGTPASRRMADGKEWTVRNLDVALPASYCFGNDEANCRRYGRLYSWATAGSACHTVGKGWRLPTDGEWRRLAKAYGGVRADAADTGRAAYTALLAGGGSAFDAVLGGGRAGDGEYARLEAHGFYWTATESAGGGVFYYNFGRGGLALHRQDEGEKDRAFSVRCVRD